MADFLNAPNFLDGVPEVDPSAMADLHPLDVFEQLKAATMPRAGASRPPSAPNAPVVPSDGGGWRGLLQMLAPVLGGMAMGGGAKQTGFLNGYSQGTEIAKQDRAEKAQAAQKRAVIASDYVQKIAEQADQITDPVQFDHFVTTADQAAARAKLTQPGEIKGQLAFNRNNLAAKQLKDLTTQLSDFEKGGYNLDELARTGAVLTLRDGGAHVPVSMAMDLVRSRPADAAGKPIAKPAANKRGFSKVDALVTGADGKATRQEINYDPDTGKYTDPDTGVVIPSKSVQKYERPNAPSETERTATIMGAIRSLKAAGDVKGAAAKQQELDDVIAAKKALGQADDRPRGMSGMDSLYSASDPKAIADAIIRGDREPDTATLGRPIGAAVDTILARAGYNKAGAVTDWKATQRHVATLNGPQQLRLNQAINALPEMLDSVETLAAKWKGGRFPLLNKANLALAKGGLYGKEAATIANQLDSQIADVTSDLGVVYMGGNSPTDHALGLASKGLKSEWDEKVLRDMVALAKKNVTIRRNSINNTGVAGASATNPYARPSAAPDEPKQPATGGGLTYQDYLKAKGKG